MINNVIPFRTIRRRPPPDNWVDAYLRFWTARLDRLADYIATLTETERGTIMSDLKFEYPADEPSMIVTRTFDAPRLLVWKAFTDPVHVARWWGPASIAPVTRVDRLELRPGGTWRYICQHRNTNETIVFTGKYLEVKAPEKLVAMKAERSPIAAPCSISASTNVVGSPQAWPKTIRSPDRM